MQTDPFKCAKGGSFMKVTKGRWAFLILSVIIPLLYLSMFLPVWNGKELLLTNSGALGTALFIFQCICLAFAFLRLCWNKIRNKDGWLNVAAACFFIISLVITLFVGYFFVLELFNVPWFPAQR